MEIVVVVLGRQHLIVPGEGCILEGNDPEVVVAVPVVVPAVDHTVVAALVVVVVAVVVEDSLTVVGTLVVLGIVEDMSTDQDEHLVGPAVVEDTHVVANKMEVVAAVVVFVAVAAMQKVVVVVAAACFLEWLTSGVGEVHHKYQLKSTHLRLVLVQKSIRIFLWLHPTNLIVQ
jgi:hypothetical protein